jgi:LAO/AO transport system kinase
VLDGVGFDVVIVETVGVGQAEVEVASLADTTVVLLAPGMGDGVQAAKAGILEVADVFVVNKADRPGADDTVRDLKGMLGLGGPPPADGSWRPPVVRTVAAQGEGAGDLLGAVQAHRDWLTRSGTLGERRSRRAADEIEHIALAALRERLGDVRTATGLLLDKLASRVVAGAVDPYAAADELMAAMTWSGMVSS